MDENSLNSVWEIIMAQNASQEFVLRIKSPLMILTTELPDITAGIPYTFQLTAKGGKKPYTWTVTGLPAGLTCSPDGLISGVVQADEDSEALVNTTVQDSRP